MENREELIKHYFAAWVENEPGCLGEVFAPGIVYSECYGPEYRGIGQIQKWFSDWNRKGKVLEWRIKKFLHQGNDTVAEWYFCCEFEGERGGFDGVSWVQFDEAGKICQLKEFQSKAEHIFPYGETACPELLRKGKGTI